MPDLREEYRALAISNHVYRLDPAASRLRVYVYRTGAAAALGHNHVLSAPKLEGYISLSSEQASDARFELRHALEDLVVDDAAVRAESGSGFSSARSTADIEGTRRNMLGERGFDAQRFPMVLLRSKSIEGEWPVLTVQVEVSLHGVTRTLPVMLRVDHAQGGLRVSGVLQLRQSDFEMTPFSALGGLMAVQDEVSVTFDLVANPARF